MIELENWLMEAVQRGASDLFAVAGKPPALRVDGVIRRQEPAPAVTAADVERFRRQVLGSEGEARYAAEGAADASWKCAGAGRFRLNFLQTLNGPMVAARPVGDGGALEFGALNLPPVLAGLCTAPRGLILLTGSTGCGKSTTLGAMVNHLNRTEARHIITIEDPVEFVHHDQLALITQREISSDVQSFSAALREAMRENPDVIVIGELRDAETVLVAVNAALTGHLVIGTLHSSNTVQAVERMVNWFPEGSRSQLARDLGAALLGVVSQRLLPTVAGGRVPAVEVLVGTPTVRKLAGERDYRGLEDLLTDSAGNGGMMTFNRAIYRLYADGEVSLEAALAAVDNRDEFKFQIEGMERGVDAFRNHYGTGLADGNDSDVVDLRQLLRSAVKSGASDLVLTAGAVPRLRINGQLRSFELPELQPDDTRRLLYSVLSSNQRVEFETGREIDLALAVSLRMDRMDSERRNFRFRLNGFFQRGSIGLVARVIPDSVPPPEALGLPEALVGLTVKQQGLILITGPTGSGKTTTLAALVDHINRTRAAHIITVEDPIEYVHANLRSVIEQRELHADTLGFAAALKYVLRQAPDVIMIGEMRDVETIAAALTAAETGHLVLATLHTNSAPQTVDRIIDSFPARQQNQIRQQLAEVLLATVSQRLLPRRDGQGRAAAFEVMMGTPPVRSLIREAKGHMLQSCIETGARDGMITLARSLEILCEAGVVERSEIDRLNRDPAVEF